MNSVLSAESVVQLSSCAAHAKKLKDRFQTSRAEDLEWHRTPIQYKIQLQKKLEIIPEHLTGENMISFKVSFLGFLWLTVGWKVYIKCSFSPILVLLSWVVCYLPGFAQRVPFLCRFVSSLHIHYINSLSCSLWNVFLGFLAVTLNGRFQIELTAYS